MAHTVRLDAGLVKPVQRELAGIVRDEAGLDGFLKAID